MLLAPNTIENVKNAANNKEHETSMTFLTQLITLKYELEAQEKFTLFIQSLESENNQINKNNNISLFMKNSIPNTKPINDEDLTHKGPTCN